MKVDVVCRKKINTQIFKLYIRALIKKSGLSGSEKSCNVESNTAKSATLSSLK